MRGCILDSNEQATESLANGRGELDPEYLGVVGKVAVGRQDGKFAPQAHRAQEQIGIGALHTAGATFVEATRRLDVVLGLQGFVGEGAQRRGELAKLSWVLHPGEE